METLFITSLGVINPQDNLHIAFAQKYLDHKREERVKVAYTLYEHNNLVHAVRYAKRVDDIVLEQMHLTLATS